MSVSARARPQAFPRLPVAAVVLAAIAVSVAVFLRDDAAPAGRASAFPAPSPIPTETFPLQRVGAGGVTGWVMSEPLVGPRDVAVDADGTVWITEQNRGIVDTFADGTLSRHLTNAFPDTGAYGLAAGPGAMWFTAYPGGIVGRVFPDGTANVFDAIDPSAATLGIAAGPHGVMWVTDVHRGVILRIQPNGIVDQIAVPATRTRAAAPRDIVRGADGAMWFTDVRGRSVWRVAATGEPTLDRFPLLSAPSSIVVGPDGSLWVTLLKDDRLARIDTADGSVELVPIPDASGQMNGLAVQDDGSIWISQASRHVLHVRSDGTTIEPYRLPGAAAYADGIAIAPDGTVWAAASDANMIVAITP